MRRLPVIAAVVLVSPLAALSAQANPESVKLRNDCRLAAQALSTGHPGPKTTWALGFITTCEEEGGAAALASAVRGLRASTDTATLHLLRRQAGSFRDAEVLAALLEVAGDPAGSVPARIYALLAIGSIVSPDERYTYEDATTELDAKGFSRCSRQTNSISDYYQVQGAPLPADYRARIYDLLRSIRADSSTPLLVRAATSCAY